MGYDSNIKSSRAERRQHFMMLLSLAGLTLACFLVVSLLHPNASPKTATIAVSEKSFDEEKSSASGSLRTGTKDVSSSTTDKALASLNANSKLENAAAERVERLDAEVRALKATGIIMETDEHALQLTSKLQRATRELINLRYGGVGKGNYRVRLDLEFQPSIPDFEARGKEGSILIDLAPISLIPCSVFNFLEIARTWKHGAFHRNAGHVLQAMARSNVTKSMPFQEYSSDYPHKKGTIGYAGRPSGPEFYISIEDNTQNHGPGSQQKKNPNEADSIIGTVIEGMDDVVPRIHTMPGREFIDDKAKWVLIRRMHILVPSDQHGNVNGYVEYSCSPLELPA